MIMNNNIYFPIARFLIYMIITHCNIINAQTDSSHVKPILTITDHLKSPLRIAISPQDIIYVTDAAGSKICKYDSDGNFIGEIKDNSVPLAIAVTSTNLVYIGDSKTGTVKLLKSNGQLLKTITENSDLFEMPSSAAISDNNILYVVDSKKKQIRYYDANGNKIGSFGDGILEFPTGIAVDRRNNRILVTEHGGLTFRGKTDATKLIHAFDMSGSLLISFGEYGNKTGQFGYLQGIAVDNSGQIYVVDSFQGTISVLNEDGNFITTIGQFGAEPGQLRIPMDLAIDSKQRLWVTSMNNSSIEVYDIKELSTLINKPCTETIPEQNQLLQNYPNPFNSGTFIPFNLSIKSHVIIQIYNEIGKRIQAFDLGECPAGNYATGSKAVFWDGTNYKGNIVASGIYFYEIQANNFNASGRMLLVK